MTGDVDRAHAAGRRVGDAVPLIGADGGGGGDGGHAATSGEGGGGGGGGDGDNGRSRLCSGSGADQTAKEENEEEEDEEENEGGSKHNDDGDERDTVAAALGRAVRGLIRPTRAKLRLVGRGVPARLPSRAIARHAERASQFLDLRDATSSAAEDTAHHRPKGCVPHDRGFWMRWQCTWSACGRVARVARGICAAIASSGFLSSRRVRGSGAGPTLQSPQLPCRSRWWLAPARVSLSELIAVFCCAKLP
jgi:hypothetical protein